MTMWITIGGFKPCCRNSSPRYFAWVTVRGKPSNTKPWLQSGRSIRSATIFSTSESGTSSPRSIIGLAFKPSGVPLATCSRSMSPVDKCGAPYFPASTVACVPFPEPGGPRKITARSSFPTGRSSSATLSPLTTAAQTALARKAFVIAHDELCLELLHRIHRHAHHDQERGTAEIKRYSKPVQNPLREVPVKPVAAEPVRQVVQVDARDHPFRKQANQREINGADEGKPLQDGADVFRGAAARADARNKTAVLAHVVGEFRGVENDADIEKRKQDDHRDVDERVEGLAPLQLVGDGLDKRPARAKDERRGGGKRQQGAGENRRNHAARVHTQGQIGGLPTHHAAAHNALG